MTAPIDWVLAVERAYVAAATSGLQPEISEMRSTAVVDRAAVPRARAAAFAVASRFLAIGTPRSLSLVIDGPAQLDAAKLALEAHTSWFAPRDVRCAAADGSADALAAALGGRAVTIAEALAADIVCVCGTSVRVTAAALRRGTHVNAASDDCIDAELRALATVTDEPTGLPALAAGLVDGRQLDELTVFIAGDAAIAVAALLA